MVVRGAAVLDNAAMKLARSKSPRPWPALLAVCMLLVAACAEADEVVTGNVPAVGIEGRGVARTPAHKPRFALGMLLGFAAGMLGVGVTALRRRTAPPPRQRGG